MMTKQTNTDTDVTATVAPITEEMMNRFTPWGEFIELESDAQKLLETAGRGLLATAIIWGVESDTTNEQDYAAWVAENVANTLKGDGTTGLEMVKVSRQTGNWTKGEPRPKNGTSFNVYSNLLGRGLACGLTWADMAEIGNKADLAKKIKALADDADDDDTEGSTATDTDADTDADTDVGQVSTAEGFDLLPCPTELSEMFAELIEAAATDESVAEALGAIRAEIQRAAAKAAS